MSLSAENSIYFFETILRGLRRQALQIVRSSIFEIPFEYGGILPSGFRRRVYARAEFIVPIGQPGQLR